MSAATCWATFCSLTIGVAPTASRMLALAPVIMVFAPVLLLEVIARVRRAEVLDDAFLEEILHRLAPVTGGDAIIVLVGDDGDVVDGGGQLDRIQRLSAQQRVREDDHVTDGDVGEGP